jgi:hypothetical protein
MKVVTFVNILKFVKMQKTITFILIFSFIFLNSCQEDEDEPTEPQIQYLEEETATIRFNPSKATWFLRSAPDSVKISLTGGKPPYIIKERPAFSSKAVIDGNHLIVYPNPYDSQQGVNGFLGYDFVNVEDNKGNVNSFNIKVNHEYYKYADSTFSLQVTGDTAFNFSDFYFNRAHYDGYYNNLHMNYKEDTYGNFVNINITAENTGIADLFALEFNYYSPTLNNNYYSPLDGNQKVNVTVLSKSEVAYNFDVQLKNSGSSGDTIRLQGSFHLKGID